MRARDDLLKLAMEQLQGSGEIVLRDTVEATHLAVEKVSLLLHFVIERVVFNENRSTAVLKEFSVLCRDALRYGMRPRFKGARQSHAVPLQNGKFDEASLRLRGDVEAAEAPAAHDRQGAEFLHGARAWRGVFFTGDD